MNYLSIDCESGSVTSDFTLLSAGLIIFNDKNDCLDSLDLKLKPDDGVYIVTAQGMSVNKIDIIKHDAEAIPYKNAKPILYDFLKRNFEKHGTLTPVGQEIDGDIRSILAKLISPGSWHDFVDHRTINLISLSKYFQMQGLVPAKRSLGLQSICEYWGIDVDETQTHTAMFDAMLNIKLFRKYQSFNLQKNELISGQKSF